MLWLIGIASVWSFICFVAVSLCIVASRADDEMAAAVATTPALPEDAPFVLAFAEPDVAPAPVPVAPRTVVR